MIQIIQIGILWVDNGAIFEQIGSMRVNERIETQTRTPWWCKVLYINARITMCLTLTPQQKRIFGWTFLTGFVFLILQIYILLLYRLFTLCVFHSTYNIDDDFLNLETQNDGPNETQDQSGITIDNVLSTNGLQAYLLLLLLLLSSLKRNDIQLH